MVHGQPDYGAYAAKQTVGSMADNAELAARLGSIVTFDRKGDVIWLDDFESNIDKWETTVIGAGGGISLSAEQARSGALSCKMITGNLANNYAEIEKRLPYPTLSKHGFEISFRSFVDREFQWEMYVYKGLVGGWMSNTVAALQMRYDYPNANLEINTGTILVPVWTVIDTPFTLFTGETLFHTFKMVADLDTEMAVRAVIDYKEYDLSAYPMLSMASITPMHLRVLFRVTTRVNFVRATYADDAIITQNEP